MAELTETEMAEIRTLIDDLRQSLGARMDRMEAQMSRMDGTLTELVTRTRILEREIIGNTIDHMRIRNNLSSFHLPVEYNGKECSICLDDLSLGDHSILPCKHIFHDNCIRSWRRYKRTCPLCRCTDGA